MQIVGLIRLRIGVVVAIGEPYECGIEPPGFIGNEIYLLFIYYYTFAACCIMSAVIFTISLPCGV